MNKSLFNSDINQCEDKNESESQIIELKKKLALYSLCILRNSDCEKIVDYLNNWRGSYAYRLSQIISKFYNRLDFKDPLIEVIVLSNKILELLEKYSLACEEFSDNDIYIIFRLCESISEKLISISRLRSVRLVRLLTINYYIFRILSRNFLSLNDIIDKLVKIKEKLNLEKFSALKPNKNFSENSIQPYELYQAGDIDSQPIRKPLVSIIILQKGKSNLTIECLKSIYVNTNMEDVCFEIILLDNGSKVGEYQKVKAQLKLGVLIALGCNRGFGEGNNIAVEYAKGDFLCFMNNDVTVTKNWLSPLLKKLCEDDAIGAVGPKLIYPDGRLQEAGAFFDDNGIPIQRGMGGDQNDPIYNESIQVDYCSAAALIIRKELFIKLDGFDIRFDPAYYEDADLCFKIRDSGFQVIYYPNSTIIHHSNSTSADHFSAQELKHLGDLNREKFMQKWNKKFFILRNGAIRNIPMNITESAHYVRGEINESRNNRNKIGLFTPYPLTPGGGEKYLLSLAEALLSDCDVYLVTPFRWSYLRLNQLSKELSVNTEGLKLTSLSEMSGNILENNQYFDIFIAMGNAIAPAYSGMGKKNYYLCQFPFPRALEEIQRRKSNFDGYLSIIVYSDFVKRCLEEKFQKYKLPPKKISVLSPTITEIMSLKKEKIILHVGRFFLGGHNKKQLELVKIFKELVKKDLLSGWEFQLVGAVPSGDEHRQYLADVIKESKGFPVKVHINLSRLEINKLYGKASIYWHATGFGSDPREFPEEQEHFGITTVEAMSAGSIPIVYSSGGQREIVTHKKNGYLWNSKEQLERFTRYVISNNDSLEIKEMRKLAVERSKEFNSSKFRETLFEIIDLKESM